MTDKPPDTDYSYGYLVKNWNKVIDTTTNALLTKIPFNWHIVCHLQTPIDKGDKARITGASPIIEYDVGLLRKAIYRFTRGNIAVAFEDTSKWYCNHIHILLLLPTVERELVYFKDLKYLYEALGRKYRFFQGYKLIETDNKKIQYNHITPVYKGSKTALDYIARRNVKVNAFPYIHSSIQDIRRIPPIPDKSSIPFHKTNPYVDITGYSCRAQKQEEHAHWLKTLDFSNVFDLPPTY